MTTIKKSKQQVRRYEDFWLWLTKLVLFTFAVISVGLTSHMLYVLYSQNAFFCIDLFCFAAALLTISWFGLNQKYLKSNPNNKWISYSAGQALTKMNFLNL
jgi:hypothetical protein